MKKLISSFAVIGILALSLIGGPAMASTPSPTPTPTHSTCPDISIPEVTLPPCPKPLTEVTPIAPTLDQPTCNDTIKSGTIHRAIQPKGVLTSFAPTLRSNGLPGTNIIGSWTTEYTPAEGYKFPQGVPGIYNNLVYAPECPTAVVAPPAVAKPSEPVTTPPAVATAPVKSVSPPVAPTASPDTELAYTGPTDGWALPLGITFLVVGLMAYFLSKKRPTQY